MQREPLPSETALDVTELLEHILLFLPMSDLLRAQRVSKYFRDTILHSQCLQEALFLRPRGVWIDQTTLPELNSLFAHHTAVEYQNIGFPHKGTLYYMSAPQRILVPNPDHLIEDKGYGTWHLDVSIQNLDPVLGKDIIPLPASDGGSWQNMYMSNPPCQIHIRVWKTTDKAYAAVSAHGSLEYAGVSGQGPLKRLGDYKGRRYVLNSERGATFGQILEQAAGFMDCKHGQFPLAR